MCSVSFFCVWTSSFPSTICWNLSELTNESSKVTGYKINIWKSVAFLYINDEQSENEIKKTVPLKKSIEKNKMPRNKLNQGDERWTADIF